MSAIPEARRALEDVGLADEVDLVVAGGIRNGGDIAKCLALGADAIAIGHSALMALNCNKEIPGVTDYEGTIGVPAGQCYHCHTGRCPVGITTRIPSCESASTWTRPHTASTTSCTRYARGSDAGPRLRQDQRAQPRARGPGGADDRGRGDGTRAARGNELHPGVSEEKTLEEIKTLLAQYFENPVDYLPQETAAAQPRGEGSD